MTSPSLVTAMALQAAMLIVGSPATGCPGFAAHHRRREQDRPLLDLIAHGHSTSSPLQRLTLN